MWNSDFIKIISLRTPLNPLFYFCNEHPSDFMCRVDSNILNADFQRT